MIKNDTTEENNMYRNIGSKIKVLAIVLCILGMLFSLIGGVVFMYLTTFGFNYVELWNIVVGIVIMIVGSFVSWVSQFMLYGFGEIITRLRDIEYHFCEQSKHSDTSMSYPTNTAYNNVTTENTYASAQNPCYQRQAASDFSYQTPYNAAPAQPVNNVPSNNTHFNNAPMNNAHMNNAPMNTHMSGAYMNNIPTDEQMDTTINMQRAPQSMPTQNIPAAPMAPTYNVPNERNQ